MRGGLAAGAAPLVLLSSLGRLLLRLLRPRGGLREPDRPEGDDGGGSDDASSLVEAVRGKTVLLARRQADERGEGASAAADQHAAAARGADGGGQEPAVGLQVCVERACDE